MPQIYTRRQQKASEKTHIFFSNVLMLNDLRMQNLKTTLVYGAP